jgi:hypothetical protein
MFFTEKAPLCRVTRTLENESQVWDLACFRPWPGLRSPLSRNGI